MFNQELFEIYKKSSKSIEDDANWVETHIYSQHYKNDKENIERGVPRPFHNIQHVVRVLFFIIPLINLYRKNSHIADKLTKDDAEDMQEAALWHDSDRKDDGEDLGGDLESALNCYYYLTLNKGGDEKRARKCAAIIANKLNRGGAFKILPDKLPKYPPENSHDIKWRVVKKCDLPVYLAELPLLRDILDDADALDIFRARDVFHAEYLHYYKNVSQHNKSAALEFSLLIAEARSLGETQGDGRQSINYPIKKTYLKNCFPKTKKDIANLPILSQLQEILPPESLENLKLSCIKPFDPNSPITEQSLTSAMQTGKLFARGISAPSQIKSKVKEGVKIEESNASIDIRKLDREKGNPMRAMSMLGYGSPTFSNSGVLLIGVETSIVFINPEDCDSGWLKKRDLKIASMSKSEVEEGLSQLLQEQRNGGQEKHPKYGSFHNEILGTIYKKNVVGVYFSRDYCLASGCAGWTGRISPEAPFDELSPILKAIYIKNEYKKKTNIELPIFEYSAAHSKIRQYQYTLEELVDIWIKLVNKQLDRSFKRENYAQIYCEDLLTNIKQSITKPNMPPLDSNYDTALKQRIDMKLRKLIFEKINVYTRRMWESLDPSNQSLTDKELFSSRSFRSALLSKKPENMRHKEYLRKRLARYSKTLSFIEERYMLASPYEVDRNEESNAKVAGLVFTDDPKKFQIEMKKSHTIRDITPLMVHAVAVFNEFKEITQEIRSRIEEELESFFDLRMEREQINIRKDTQLNPHKVTVLCYAIGCYDKFQKHIDQLYNHYYSFPSIPSCLLYYIEKNFLDRALYGLENDIHTDFIKKQFQYGIVLFKKNVFLLDLLNCSLPVFLKLSEKKLWTPYEKNAIFNELLNKMINCGYRLFTGSEKFYERPNQLFQIFKVFENVLDCKLHKQALNKIINCLIEELKQKRESFYALFDPDSAILVRLMEGLMSLQQLLTKHFDTTTEVGFSKQNKIIIATTIVMGFEKFKSRIGGQYDNLKNRFEDILKIIKMFNSGIDIFPLQLLLDNETVIGELMLTSRVFNSQGYANIVKFSEACKRNKFENILSNMLIAFRLRLTNALTNQPHRVGAVKRLIPAVIQTYYNLKSGEYKILLTGIMSSINGPDTKLQELSGVIQSDFSATRYKTILKKNTILNKKVASLLQYDVLKKLVRNKKIPLELLLILDMKLIKKLQAKNVAKLLHDDIASINSVFNLTYYQIRYLESDRVCNLLSKKRIFLEDLDDAYFPTEIFEFKSIYTQLYDGVIDFNEAKEFLKRTAAPIRAAIAEGMVTINETTARDNNFQIDDDGRTLVDLLGALHDNTQDAMDNASTNSHDLQQLSGALRKIGYQIQYCLAIVKYICDMHKIRNVAKLWESSLGKSFDSPNYYEAQACMVIRKLIDDLLAEASDSALQDLDSGEIDDENTSLLPNDQMSYAKQFSAKMPSFGNLSEELAEKIVWPCCGVPLKCCFGEKYRFGLFTGSHYRDIHKKFISTLKTIDAEKQSQEDAGGSNVSRSIPDMFPR